MDLSLYELLWYTGLFYYFWTLHGWHSLKYYFLQYFVKSHLMKCLDQKSRLSYLYLILDCQIWYEFLINNFDECFFFQIKGLVEVIMLSVFADGIWTRSIQWNCINSHHLTVKNYLHWLGQVQDEVCVHICCYWQDVVRIR